MSMIQVIEEAPYVTSIETLDKYDCDFCVHGGMPFILFDMWLLFNIFNTVSECILTLIHKYV